MQSWMPSLIFNGFMAYRLDPYEMSHPFDKLSSVYTMVSTFIQWFHPLYNVSSTYKMGPILIQWVFMKWAIP